VSSGSNVVDDIPGKSRVGMSFDVRIVPSMLAFNGALFAAVNDWAVAA
jgi:hypothetical protein